MRGILTGSLGKDTFGPVPINVYPVDRSDSMNIPGSGVTFDAASHRTSVSPTLVNKQAMISLLLCVTRSRSPGLLLPGYPSMTCTSFSLRYLVYMLRKDVTVGSLVCICKVSPLVHQLIPA